MNWSETVRHLMSTDPVSVDLKAAPSTVHALLENNAFHHLPVVDGDTLVGIVSTVDLARVSLGAFVRDADTEDAWLDAQFQIKDIMTWEPEAVRAGDSLKFAAEKLADGGFHSLPVLDDDGALVGMFTSTDLIRHIINA